MVGLFLIVFFSNHQCVKIKNASLIIYRMISAAVGHTGPQSLRGFKFSKSVGIFWGSVLDIVFYYEMFIFYKKSYIWSVSVNFSRRFKSCASIVFENSALKASKSC